MHVPYFHYAPWPIGYRVVDICWCETQEAVHGCRGGGDDHAGAGRHHGRLHRFLIAGFWDAVVAAFGTFLPCHLFTILPAPYFQRLGKLPPVVAFVDGVTASN
jgi:hypothetical protein